MLRFIGTGVQMPAAKTEAHQEAIRLRVEERLSGNDITQRLGVSRGSVSAWLRDYPLTDEEQQQLLTKGDKTGALKDAGESSKYWKLTQNTEFDTRQKAKVSEAAVLFRLALFKLNPYNSIFDGDKLDLVVVSEDLSRVMKVQVRWAARGRYGLPAISLACSAGRRKQRRYKKGEFDFIVGYNLFTDTCYVWSWDEVAHLKATVTVCPEAAERWDKLTTIAP